MKQQEYENVIDSIMQIISINQKPIYYVHCCSCKNNPTGCGDNTILYVKIDANKDVKEIKPIMADAH